MANIDAQVDEHTTPIHQPMAPKSGSWHSNMTRHVPLTAHVLLTLIKVGVFSSMFC